jgi:RNA polymerase sigma-B factor
MNATLTPSKAASKAAEDRRLLVRYHDERDTSTREQLVERFLPLARHLAKRYQRRNEPLDDLMQVASVALVKSIDRFDPDLGTTFSTFAVPTIVGALKRHFRDSGWAVHVPRGMQERVRKVDRASSQLQHRLGRSPSTSELAHELCLTPEQVTEATSAARAFETVSLDGDPSDQWESPYAYSLEIEEKHYELIEYGAAIASTMKALGERDRLMLHLRFIDDLTLPVIAKRLGLSEMQVSRGLRRSLARLRAVV